MIYRATYLANKRERRRIGSFKPKPIRDLPYMAWIRTLPCIICCRDLLMRLAIAAFSSVVKSEAAHSGPHGIGQKASDHSCIPLCAWHHRLGPESYHVMGKKFFEHHGLDRLELVKALNEAYNPFQEAA